MKIKKLVLQNINSLYGKWEIDFDCEEFRRSGIFAVTGNTGSGKSTILDAICLALYGCTPRLKKETAEAVSRGCNECMCELTFLETRNQEWTATYAYQKISQGSNAGKMKKDALHTLSCNGITEAEKTTLVKAKVEEITGLDSDRFCRAVLLAQGSFDAFLSAGNKNGEILERITGTEIYSRIAEKVKQRYTGEEMKYKSIEALFNGITILSDEERDTLRQEIEELTREIGHFNSEQSALNQLLQKFQQLELQRAALAKCSEDEKLLSEEIEKFSPLKKRFEDGKKVLDADEAYRPLKALQDQHSVAATALTKSEQLLLEQEKLCADAAKALEEKSRSFQEFEKEFTALSQVLTAVNKLDTVIRAFSENVLSARSRREAELHKALECRRELFTTRRQLAGMEKNNAEDTAYLLSHEGDSELPLLRKMWEEWLKNLEDSSLALAGNTQKSGVLQKNIAALQKTLAEKEKALQSEREKFEKISAAEAAAKQKILDTLEGASKEHWQTLFETQDKCCRQAELCKSLAEHRKQLHDGGECPLCGSKEHPFAAGNIPEPDREYEVLETLKKRLNAIGDAEKDLQKISADLNSCGNVRVQLENALEQLKLQLEGKVQEKKSLDEAAEKLKTDIAAAAEKIDSALERYGLTREKGKFLLPAELELRIRKFEACKAAQAIFEEKKKEYAQRILKLHTALLSYLENCRTLRKEWRSVSLKLAAEKSRREELFGTKDPAAEAQAAEAKRKNITALLEKASRSATESATNRSRTVEEVKKTKENIALLNEEIMSARERFLWECTAAGVTEEEFHLYLLDKEEMTRLSGKDAELKARQKQLAETRSRCEMEIKLLSEFLQDKKNKEETVAGLEKLAELLQGKNQTLGGSRQKLSKDAEEREKMAEQHQKLLEQQKVRELWKALDDLIGVKDKFQRFAQGITLEHLLVLANNELEKLSGRYRLLRSKEEELGIDVADKEQGDVIRSCKTLSGGERFLVSLSLALGLSQMAGERISVDSLFLDEGFGTLDADTLEIALAALSNLRNRGKLVGVISHVAALSEKIPCIIEVIPSGGGRSTLKGPGVRAIAPPAEKERKKRRSR